MADFGVPRPVTPSVLFSGGRHFSAVTGSGTLGFAWQSANRAVLMPFEIQTEYLVEAFGWINGGTVSGNVDAGIYTLDGVRLMSTGSVAQSGTSTTQIEAITPTLLPPGTYYLALAMDNTTGGIPVVNYSASDAHMFGFVNVDSSFPLPSTLTPAFAAVGRVPACGIYGRSMAATPRVGLTPVLVLSPLSLVSVGLESLSMGNSGATSSSAWPSGNRALFVPFAIERPWTARKTVHWNASTTDGNMDIGIYTRDGRRIVSTGSFVASGANAAQVNAIAETTLAPGSYYMAMATNGTRSKGVISGISVAEARMLGVMEMDTAMPLPATATLSPVSTAIVPIICFDSRS